jgi:hypothetical protein
VRLTLAGPCLPNSRRSRLQVATVRGLNLQRAIRNGGEGRARRTYVPEDGGDEDLEEHFLGDGRPASPARSGFETTRHS